MAEVVTKKTQSKKTQVKKTEKEVEQTVNPMEELMKSMTPEMMQQFMEFMQQKTKTVDVVETKEIEKPKLNKAYLSKIRDREVVVRSVSSGIVGFESKKTNVFYSWLNYGDTEVLSVGEIIEMESRSKLFLHTPWLVIEDDEVNEALGILECKEMVDKFDDFETFLELPMDEIKDSLKKVSRDYLRTISGKVQQAINDGVLTDFRKIRELEKMMKVELKY